MSMPVSDEELVRRRKPGHTLDAPFIFESLKNYFRRAGLRVFSAIHPMLSVRRQWERIVTLGAPDEEGSRESFCHFRIERVDSRADF